MKSLAVKNLIRAHIIFTRPARSSLSTTTTSKLRLEISSCGQRLSSQI